MFEISADPSKAEEALNRLASDTGKSFDNASGSVKPLNDNLLSSREATRLLSEELGVHLPRAVTSAIGEILPGIASMGDALVGAF